jgi:hypothetical protein
MLIFDLILNQRTIEIEEALAASQQIVGLAINDLLTFEQIGGIVFIWQCLHQQRLLYFFKT